MTKKVVKHKAYEDFTIKPFSKEETIYHEDKKNFGIQSEKGLNIEKFKDAIKKLQ